MLTKRFWQQNAFKADHVTKNLRQNVLIVIQSKGVAKLQCTDTLITETDERLFKTMAV